MNIKLLKKRYKNLKIEKQLILELDCFRLMPWIVGILVVLSLAVARFNVVIFSVDSSQMSAVFSTTAQVVGGLYGLTLTAYVFFVDKFKDSASDDETLYDAICGVLNILYKNLIYISILCGGVIISSLIGIIGLCKLSVIEYWILNGNVLIFVLEIMAILLFGVRLLDPQKIDKELKQIKQDSEKNRAANAEIPKKENVAEFFEYYNKLESEILHIAQYYVPEIAGQRQSGKPSIIRGLQVLSARQIVNSNVMRLVDDLRKFRNILAHGLECSVTDSKLEDVKQVEKAINEILGLLENQKENTQEWNDAIKRLYDIGGKVY